MDRKQFMRDVYSSYWLDAREKKYGFMEYDKNLCTLITSAKPDGGTLLEVAIGTGYPIADFLQKSGYEVHGIDISDKLIERCLEVNPQIRAVTGDAENLAYPEAMFDAVYCFHATWYFPDLPRVLDEMNRVTKPGGVIIFDIENRDNPSIAADFEHKSRQVRPGLVARAQLQARNVAKVVLRRGNPNWHGVIYEIPTYPGEVLAWLDKNGEQEFTVYGRREEDQSLIEVSGGEVPLDRYQRLVFVIEKNGPQ
jgi:SAM-dependent methyltransferase